MSYTQMYSYQVIFLVSIIISGLMILILHIFVKWFGKKQRGGNERH